MNANDRLIAAAVHRRIETTRRRQQASMWLLLAVILGCAIWACAGGCVYTLGLLR